MAGVLTGLRVVERGDGAAVRILGVILADQGADVVRVGAPPEGPPPWARGKRYVAGPVSLADADVLLGDAADPTPAPPGLITCALPAFPPGHPLAGSQAGDAAIAAASGLYERPGGAAPRWYDLPIASVIAALYGAIGVLAAVHARSRDGRGQHVEVAVSDAALAAQELGALLTIRPPKTWRTLQWAATPLIGAYRCADGRWLYLHAGLSRHARRLAAELPGLGLPEAVLAEPTAIPSVRLAARARRALGSTFATRPAAEWETRLAAAGLCAVVVRSRQEWLAHPQSGAVDVGGVRQPGPGVSLRGARSEPRASTTSAALGWRAPSPWAAPLGAPDPRPPLAGVRVLDLTQVIAGPVAGRALAELGADVVRVENPHFRAPWVEAFHLAYNAGKRSATLDLVTPSGRGAFWRVAEAHRPDVVLENLRPGASARLGVDEGTLRRRFPGLVHVAISAYGASGPWGGRPGWEQTAQAATGIQLAYGGLSPDLLPVAVNDLGTGLFGALGALLGLLAVRRGAPGAAAEATLIATAAWLQSHDLWDDGRRRFGASRAGLRGASPACRFYRAKGGWIFVDAPAAAVRALGPDPEAAIAKETGATWRERLGGGVVPRTSLAAALAAAPGRTRREAHAGVGAITLVSPPLRLSRTPLAPIGPARPRGADTAALAGAEAPPERAIRAPNALLWGRDQAKWAAFLVWSRISG